MPHIATGQGFRTKRDSWVATPIPQCGPDHPPSDTLAHNRLESLAEQRPPGRFAGYLGASGADMLACPSPSRSPPKQHFIQPSLPLVLIHDLEAHHLVPHRGHELGPIGFASVLAANVED